MALEIERKYFEVDFDSLRRRLRQCGAQGGDVHLERNRIYDLPDGSLRAGHHLLRLRSQEWPDHAQNVLTLKLPPVSAPDAAFKVREERETPVTDAAQMHSILEGLGYVVRACYEKIRETWRLEHTSIDMDIVPFARVVELEELAGGYQGHGGGDWGLIEALYDDMLTVPSPEDMTTSIEESAHSHVMAFATEHARLSGQVVDVADFERKVAEGILNY